MGTRAVVAVGIAGAILFGLAAFLLTAGGDEPSIPAAAQSSNKPPSQSQPTVAATTSNGPLPGSTSTVQPATVVTSGIQGAVVPATPVTPPYEEDLVKNGGNRFAIPLRTWALIGDRFGAPRSEGRIHGGINFVLAANATQDVYSPCDGTLNGSGSDATYGKYLVVDCGGGWLAVLGNIQEQKAPARSEVLQGETVVATVSGYLYFEIRFLRVPVNPEPYLDFTVPAGQRRPEPPAPGETPEATGTPTASATATGTATRTATPRPGTTPVPGGGGDPGTDPGEDPEPTSPPAATSTPRPPTSTPTPVPPTSTPTSTPTPQPPTPTRTPTPRPIF